MIAKTPALDLIGESTNGNEAATLITESSPEPISLTSDWRVARVRVRYAAIISESGAQRRW
jgi:hypothetical protein